MSESQVDRCALQAQAALERLVEEVDRALTRDAAGGSTDAPGALTVSDSLVYRSLMSTVLRVVFLVHAERSGLWSTGTRRDTVSRLYDDLVHDARAQGALRARFDAHGRLGSLFRDLPVVSDEPRLPDLDDGAVLRFLEPLLAPEAPRCADGARALELLGAIHEHFLGQRVRRISGPAVCLGPRRVWAEIAWLREQAPAARSKWLKNACGLGKARVRQIERALEVEARAPHTADDHARMARALDDLAPQRKRDEPSDAVSAAGRLVLSPGDERRRSGTHYTPRSLTEPLVRRTLEPLLARFGEGPSEAQILSLKICDPALGSGAFLMEVVRQLAAELIASWARDNRWVAGEEARAEQSCRARRLVAQHCVYGVDKNPLAVALAKLSLWLLVADPSLPLSFLDHALRHGDALVGLTAQEIAAFHWRPTSAPPLAPFAGLVERACEQALIERRARGQLAGTEAGTELNARRHLERAEQSIDTPRLLADLCVGAFFTDMKGAARELENERRRALVERWLGGEVSVEPELRALAAEVRKRHTPFHWCLEFPELFGRASSAGASSDASTVAGFVGNPPFLGGTMISTANGGPYLAWLHARTGRAANRADLCTYFFRRAGELLGPSGTIGLIATSTIAEGDSAEHGLSHLLRQGFVIGHADKNLAWPGVATVRVSTVCLAKGRAAEGITPVLNGKPVPVINSRLEARMERPPVRALRSNAGVDFQGAKIYGQGFLLSREEALELLAAHPDHAAHIHPYIGGADISGHPQGMSERFVIDFEALTLAEAGRFPALLRIVEARVRPQRERAGDSADGQMLRQFWWRFFRGRPELRAALRSLPRCLVAPRVAKHMLFAFQPVNAVFSEQLCIFALSTFTPFAVLQSRIHEGWARSLSSTLGAGLRYSTTDAFAGYPFPQADPRSILPAVEAAGQAFYEARQRFMTERDWGLTRTYNALGDAACTDARVVELRALHEEMERTVLEAYGWQDLEVPAYCPGTAAQRGHGEAFGHELLERLHTLHEERARRES